MKIKLIDCDYGLVRTWIVKFKRDNIQFNNELAKLFADDLLTELSPSQIRNLLNKKESCELQDFRILSYSCLKNNSPSKERIIKWEKQV